MKDRIKKLRKKLGLSQSAFGDKAGVSLSAVQKWEYGINTPSEAVSLLLCREFGVNEAWLRSGEGDMFLPRSQEDEIASYLRRILGGGASQVEKNFILAVAATPEAEWPAIIRFLHRLNGSETK